MAYVSLNLYVLCFQPCRPIARVLTGLPNDELSCLDFLSRPRNIYLDRARMHFLPKGTGPITMLMKRLSFIFLLSTLFSAALVHGATFTAASCNTSDVQTAINSAANGDTVVIPNGSCSWSSGISTGKQITLQGATAGGVTITHNAGSGTLLTVNIGSSFHTTIANLNFLPGGGTGNYITVQGTGMVPLMHDCRFNLPNFQLQQAVQWNVTGGVIWNTTFESTQNLSGACGSQVGSDSGCLVVKPTKNWDDASTLGALDTTGTNNLYIEDSVFSNVGQCPDMDDNARVVVRHSQIIGSSGLTHGPTSTYGGRQFEFYDNAMTYPNINRNLNRYFWTRAGTGVITGNSVQALSGQCYGNKDSFTFIVESATRAQSHGCCTSYMCFHQPGSGSDGTSGHTFLSPSQTPYDSFQQSDPIYIWNNTGAGQTNVGLNDSDMSCSTGNTTATFFVRNRDYFVDGTSNPNNGAKPGWARFTYPHPLRQGTGAGSSPAPPTNLQATVQ